MKMRCRKSNLKVGFWSEFHSNFSKIFIWSIEIFVSFSFQVTNKFVCLCVFAFQVLCLLCPLDLHFVSFVLSWLSCCFVGLLDRWLWTCGCKVTLACEFVLRCWIAVVSCFFVCWYLFVCQLARGLPVCADACFFTCLFVFSCACLFVCFLTRSCGCLFFCCCLCSSALRVPPA